MIGKHTVVCSKCRRPLDCRTGWYEHNYPERRSRFEGYHVSQVIHPYHYAYKEKWQELLYKQKTYSKTRFYNEILGEPCDESTKLLTIDDLRNAQNGFDNSMDMAMRALPDYETVVMGVDWSGKGENLVSSTAVVIIGVNVNTDKLDVLYCERLPQSMREIEEVRTVLNYATAFKVSYIAHDFTGAGSLRETLMIQAGVDPAVLAPFTYVNSVHQTVVSYKKATTGIRDSWHIDKPRSLVILTSMIRAGKVTIPKLEGSFDVMKDLLALQEEVREVPHGNDVYLITKTPKKYDDAAHALNFGCAAVWNTKDAYPDIVNTEKYNIDADTRQLTDPAEVRWDEDQ